MMMTKSEFGNILFYVGAIAFSVCMILLAVGITFSDKLVALSAMGMAISMTMWIIGCELTKSGVHKSKKKRDR